MSFLPIVPWTPMGARVPTYRLQHLFKQLHFNCRLIELPKSKSPENIQKFKQTPWDSQILTLGISKPQTRPLHPAPQLQLSGFHPESRRTVQPYRGPEPRCIFCFMLAKYWHSFIKIPAERPRREPKKSQSAWGTRLKAAGAWPPQSPPQPPTFYVMFAYVNVSFPTRCLSLSVLLAIFAFNFCFV